MAVKTPKRPARRSKKKVSARRTRATKRASTKRPRETTSQVLPDIPVPTSSDEYAYQIRQSNLDICEEHKKIARLFHTWCVWFTGADLATGSWFKEVWKYLPEARWKEGRIRGYIFMDEDTQIRNMTGQQWLLTDPEAVVWLGNPNCGGRVPGTRDTAIRWLKKRWREGVYVDKEALARNFRRGTRMKPKLHFTNESSKVRVTVEILDESCTDAELKREAQYVLRNGCERSTIQRTASGNYTEVRPRQQ